MLPRPAVRAAHLALAAALGSAACATPGHQPAREAAPAEVLVEVLPREAELWVDGVDAGRGTRTVPVPDAEHVYTFHAAAPGFAAVERAGDGAELAGARVAMVLPPVGLATARQLDLDDPAGLLVAGAALLRDGRAAQAVEYGERAAELTPGEAAPHRLVAEAARAAGDRARAAREYAAYLRLAPDAADRDEVERAVDELRADVRAKR
jgi:tetratricopeptide (TPR) repeat protein